MHKTTLSLKNREKDIQFNLWGFLIALLMFVSFSMKEVHLFLHHHHEEVKICDARAGEHHFHDKDYIHESCPLCDFTFSCFELNIEKPLDFSIPNTVISSQTFIYLPFFSHKPAAFAPLRAPPSLGA
ncbi:MAG: hypothetical protein JNL70_19435 [Saprospiraceae bacterium]|nr:hypothetical protein [Saprospiraceae bacterium]